MKRITKIFSAVFCGVAMTLACNKNEIVENPEFDLMIEGSTDVLISLGGSETYTQEVNYFRYASAAVAADSVFKAQRFRINSNCDWKIVPLSDDQSWVQPFPEQGGSKDGLIFFRIDRNNDRFNDRLAGYKFVVNNGISDIEVPGAFMIHQVSAKPRLETSVKNIEIAAGGANANVTVTSNIAWTYSLSASEEYASEDPALWTVDKTVLKYEDPDSTILALKNTVKIGCPDNSDGSIRGFVITIKAVDESLGLAPVNIPVVQYGVTAELDGFPVKWNAANNKFPKWASASNPIPTLEPAEGNGSICFYRAEVPGLDRTASTCDVSGSNPRVNGAWPGDYFEFTADSPVPAGSLIKLQFEARISGSGARHWRLEYLDGEEWVVPGKLQTIAAPDGTPINYTHDMFPGGSADDYNQIIAQVVKYQNTTSQVKFRYYVASNVIASSGAQMDKPTTASARLDFSGAATGTEPIISCVAAGGEELIYGNVNCSEEILLFEGAPAAPKDLTVSSDQDVTITTNVPWLTVDQNFIEAFEEKTIKVTCANSDLTTMREGLVQLQSGMTKVSVRVVQSAAGGDLAPFISIVGGNTKNIDGDVQSFKVKVQSNVEYEVSIPADVDWISTEPLTKAAVTVDQIELYCSANTVAAERSATINFINEANGLVAPLTVIQGPAAPSGETVVSWVFSVDAMTGYKDAFEKSNSLPAAKGTGYISWVDLPENVALDVNTKKTHVIGGTGEPYVTGAWVGDYWEFTVPNLTVPAGSSVTFDAVTRCSATGQKYWAMMYLDGTEWKYVKETAQETESTQKSTYTHILTSANQNFVETFKLTKGLSNEPLKIRFICTANWQCSGAGALAAPNGGTHRWSVPAGTTDGPIITIKEPVAEVVFKEDFEWFAEQAAALGATSAVEADNPSSVAVNILGKVGDANADAILAGLAERGYEYLWGATYTKDATEEGVFTNDPSVITNPNVLYICPNYLKFGKSSVSAAFRFPLKNLKETKDLKIEFDWCWQVTGSWNADIMTLVVQTTKGTFEVSNSAVSPELTSTQSTEGGKSHLAWQHASVVLKGAGEGTVLTIRPKNANPYLSNPARGQNRWYLDNIKIVAE